MIKLFRNVRMSLLVALLMTLLFIFGKFDAYASEQQEDTNMVNLTVPAKLELTVGKTSGYQWKTKNNTDRRLSVDLSLEKVGDWELIPIMGPIEDEDDPFNTMKGVSIEMDGKVITSPESLFHTFELEENGETSLPVKCWWPPSVKKLKDGTETAFKLHANYNFLDIFISFYSWDPSYDTYSKSDQIRIMKGGEAEFYPDGVISGSMADAYEFKGWFSEPGGKGIEYKKGMTFVEDMNFYCYATEKERSAKLTTGESFNSSIPADVTSVKFCYDKVPAEIVPVDVSEAGDHGVVAWQDGTTWKVSTQRSGVNTIANEDCSHMFEGTQVTELDLSTLDTSETTNMSSMFKDNNELKYAYLKNLDTSNVTNMSYMFSGCDNLRSWNAVKKDDDSDTLFTMDSVTDISYMFQGVPMKEIDLSKFNTSKVTNMNGTFKNCGSESLNIHMKTDSLESMSQAFMGCEKVSELDLSTFNTDGVTMSQAFNGMNVLERVVVSETFSFNGQDGLLPVPSSEYIFGTDGMWYNTQMKAFSPDRIPSGVADTYTVADPVPDMLLPGSRFNKVIPAGATSVTFDADLTFPTDGTETFDVSLAQDGSILAWMSGTSLNISAGDSTRKIYANTDSSYMFAKGKGSSITRLSLTELDMSKCKNTSHMFERCSSVTSFNIPNTWVTTNVRDMSYMFANCSKLSNSGFTQILGGLKVDGCENMSHMFESCNSLTEVTSFPSSFNSSNVRDMSYMFANCGSITRFLTSGMRTQSCEDMSGMFSILSSCTMFNLSGLQTSNVLDMNHMFSECHVATMFTNVNSMNTSNVIDMSGMFSFCDSLKTLYLNLNTSSVRDMSGMFINLKKVTTGLTFGPNFKTGNVEDMSGMFAQMEQVTQLNLSYFDTSKVKRMDHMFRLNCRMDKLVQNFDTSKVEETDNMFEYCQRLKDLDTSKWEFHLLKDASCMFEDHALLETLDVGNWGMENVENMSQMFYVTTFWYHTGPEYYFNSTTGGMNKYGRLYALRGIENWNPSKCQSFKKMFASRGTDTGSNAASDHSAYQVFKSLDLSGWDVKKGADTRGMFEWCVYLNTISVNETLNLADSGLQNVNCDKIYMSNVIQNGKWYDENGIAYDAESIPKNKAGKYSVFNPHSINASISMPSEAKYIKFTSEKAPANADIKIVNNGTASNIVAWMESDGTYKISTQDPSRKIVGAAKSDSMFYNMVGLIGVDFENFDSSEVKDIKQMFYNCSSLEWVKNIANIISPQVENMSHMFYNCKSLKAIDMAGINTSGVKIMDHMFYGCSSLKSVDGLGTLKLTSLTDIDGMFQDCKVMEGLDLSSFDFSKISTRTNMFKNMYMLKRAKFNNTYFSAANAYLPAPSKTYIAGADGYWYSESTKTRYASTQIPSGKADTYVAVNPDLVVGELSTVLKAGNCLPTPTIEELIITDIPWNGVGTLSDVSSAQDGGVVYWTDDKVGYVSTQRSGVKVKANENSSQLFYNKVSLKSIEGLNDHLDVSGMKNMYMMFYNSNGLKELNISSWKVQSTDIRNIFQSMTNLRKLDISGIDSSVATVGSTFLGCSRLEEVTVGDEWEWKGHYLPEQTEQYVSGANGKWLSKKTNQQLSPSEAPNGADTYTSKDLSEYVTMKNVSFSSLSGVRGVEFTNIKAPEGVEVTDVSNWSNGTVVMWQDGDVVYVSSQRKDKVIKATQTAMQFNGSASLEYVDFFNLDASTLTSISNMFSNCSSLKEMEFNFHTNPTGAITYAQNAFTNCSSLRNVDLSGLQFNVKYATNSSYSSCSFYRTFYNCTALDTIRFGSLYLANYYAKTGSGTPQYYASYQMFYGCGVKRFIVDGSLTANAPAFMNSVFQDNGDGTTKQISFRYPSSRPSGGVYNKNVTTLPAGTYYTSADAVKVYMNHDLMEWNDLKNHIPEGIERVSVIYKTSQPTTKIDVSKEQNGTIYAWQSGTEWLISPAIDGYPIILDGNQSGFMSNMGQLKSMVLSNIDVKKSVNMDGAFNGSTNFDMVDLESESSLTMAKYLPNNGTNGLWYPYGDYSVGYLPNDIDMTGEWVCNQSYQLTHNMTYGYSVLNLMNIQGNQNVKHVVFTDLKVPIGVISTDLGTTEDKNVVKGWLDGDTYYVSSTIKGDKIVANPSSYNLFYNCSYLETIDLSMLDMSKVANMNSMFYNCASIEELDLSGSDNSSVSSMNNAFGAMNKLKKVTVGEKWKFISGGHLPTPSGTYIEGADGKWYSENDKIGYDPGKITGNVNDVYYADRRPFEQFLPLDMGKLTVPDGVVGVDFLSTAAPDGAVTTDISSGNDGSVVYYIDDASVLHVCPFVDGKKIQATETSISFSGLTSLEWVDFSGLMPGNISSFYNSFNGCLSLKSVNMKFNGLTNSITTMASAFNGCVNLKELDLSYVETTPSTNFVNAFNNVPLQKLTIGTAYFESGNATTAFKSGYPVTLVVKGSVTASYCSKTKFPSNLYRSETIDGAVNYYSIQPNSSTRTIIPEGTYYSNQAMVKPSDSNTTIQTKSLPTIAKNAKNIVFTDEDILGENALVLSTGAGVVGFLDGDTYYITTRRPGKKVSLTTTVKFTSFSNLEYVDMRGVDFKNSQISGKSMFTGCSKLREISGIESMNDVGNNMYSMFSGCSSLESLDLSGLKIKPSIPKYANYFQYVFYNCTSLKYLDISGLDLSGMLHSDNTKSMFNGCSSLEIVKTNNLYITFPSPSSKVPGYDGKWYDGDGNAITPSASGCGNRTLYASKSLIPVTYDVSECYDDSEMVGVTQPIVDDGEEVTTYQVGDDIYADLKTDGTLVIYGSGDLYEDFETDSTLPWNEDGAEVKHVKVQSGLWKTLKGEIWGWFDELVEIFTYEGDVPEEGVEKQSRDDVEVMNETVSLELDCQSDDGTIVQNETIEIQK